jgi:hypothetical protein
VFSVARYEFVSKLATLRAAAERHATLAGVVAADCEAGVATAKNSCTRNMHRLAAAMSFIQSARRAGGGNGGGGAGRATAAAGRGVAGGRGAGRAGRRSRQGVAGEPADGVAARREEAARLSKRSGGADGTEWGCTL